MVCGIWYVVYGMWYMVCGMCIRLCAPVGDDLGEVIRESSATLPGDPTCAPLLPCIDGRVLGIGDVIFIGTFLQEYIESEKR